MEHVEERRVQTEEERHDEAPLADSSRWLGAVSYLSLLSLVVLYELKHRAHGDFVRFHARQGFALFFAEVVLLIVYFVLDNSLGTIPVLGALLMIVYRLATGLAVVGLSVWGFVEALGGQRRHLPILGDYAKRVPVG